MENSEAMELLEGVSNGMSGKLKEAISKAVEALKNSECSACKVDYGEVIKVKYHSEERLKKIAVGDLIDLYTAQESTLYPGDYKCISLGVSMKLPEGYEAWVLPRSSTFKKFGVLMVNGVGIIDESYCGNRDVWRFPVYATRTVTIPKGERIAQFRIFKHQPNLTFEEVENLDSPDRGGFGSTDKEM